MSRTLLQNIVVSLLYQDKSPFGAKELGPSSNRPMCSHVAVKFIDSFLHRFKIVIRKQSGCSKRSIAHVTYIEKQVSYHSGRPEVLFTDGILYESYVEDMDEILFNF